MLINIFYIFQADGELRTYGSATELTGSTATVIMIKHGDLLCANLGKYFTFFRLPFIITKDGKIYNQTEEVFIDD